MPGHPTIRRRGLLATVTTTLLLLGLLVPPASAAPRASAPIAEGLAGPLGLAVARDGSFYVGEAFSGELTRISRQGRERTLLQVEGGEVAGLAVNRRGRVVFTQSVYEGPPEPDAEPTIVDSSLELLRRRGESRTIVSTYRFEQRRNPDGDVTYGFQDIDDECAAQVEEVLGFPATYPGIVDSHAYAVAIDGRRYVVADAAGNDILRVDRRGRTRVLAVLPPVPQVIPEELAAEEGLPCAAGATFVAEPVPTDVEVGRDGHYYVTTLPGGPELPGAGALWRVHRRTGELTQIATGFDGAVDLAIARNGTIYVAELFGNQISRVRRDGTVTPYVEVPMPGTVEFGRGNRLYATINVLAEEGGDLVRIRR